jgi:hypothetical protein
LLEKLTVAHITGNAEWWSQELEVKKSQSISPISQWTMSLAGHVACKRIENTYRILFGEPEEKRTLGRHKRIGKDDIKVGFKSRMGKGGLYLSGLGWEKVAAFEKNKKSIGLCQLCGTS